MQTTQRIATLTLLALGVVGCASQPQEREMETNTLREQLNVRYEGYLASADDEKKRIYREGIEAVASSGVLERAKNIGDRAPDFTLPNADGDDARLRDLLAGGPVVIVWYRGGWCPYCNLTLEAYHKALPEIEAQGATLVAISPELPDRAVATMNQNELDFLVLSDVGNRVARDYGVVFTLTDQVHEIYNRAFGFDNHNGESTGELPLATTYVIDRDGVIRYAFLDPDYTKRAEPGEVVEALRAL